MSQDIIDPMAMINNPETALALLQANGARDSNQQQQGHSNSLPNANNMLINGNSSNSVNSSNGATAGSLSRTGRSSSTSAGASTSSLQQLPRPSSSARGNVAAFLTKLYKYISWS